jgi:hypothetical protein
MKSNSSDLKRCPENSTGIIKDLLNANDFFMRERKGTATLSACRHAEKDTFHFLK